MSRAVHRRRRRIVVTSVIVVVPGSLNEQGVHDEDDGNDRAPRERANPLVPTLGRDASHVFTCTAHGNNATRRV